DLPIGMEMLGRLRRDPFVNKDNLILDDINSIGEELGEFRKSGGRTVVECTTIGLGRNPLALKKISTSTKVNIIAGAGYYVEHSRPPYVAKASEDDLAEEIIRDLTVGIGDSGVRAGVIGEIGLSAPLSAQDKKVIRAVGKAHNETGAPII